jgi:hypothetical protein
MLNWLVDHQYALAALSWGFVGVTLLCGALALIGSREANKRQATQLMQLEGANIEARRKLEAERTTRLSMEQDLYPREIPVIDHGGTTNLDSLKPFAGIQMIVEYASRSEATAAARNIMEIGREVGWTTIKTDVPSDLIDFNDGVDGVVIEPYKPTNPDPPANERRAEEAAKALATFLEAHNWKARVRPGSSRSGLPLDTLKIQVGVKPTPYFLKPAIDAVKERHEKESRRNPYRLK